MNRRTFLRNVGLSASSLFLSNSFVNCGNNSQKPNILLIMADDMGFSDIGCYCGEVDTPNLNRLATNGFRFTQFYNQARCCPTRASLLTGLYPHQTGVGAMTNDSGIDGYRGDLNSSCVTIAEVLKESGYGTYMSGKWHVTKHIFPEDPKHNWPRQRGFDRFFGTIIGAGSFFKPTTLVNQNNAVTNIPDDFYYTDAITDKAIKYVQDHRISKTEDPFFLYVSYTSPHWPLHALEEDIKKYSGKFDAGWDQLRKERYERMIQMGLIDEDWQLTERDPTQPPWEDVENKKWQSRRMEVYAAQIDRMDQGIGKIVKLLVETQQLENTLIIFLADNGGCAEELTKDWENWAFNAPVANRLANTGNPVVFGNKPEIMPGNDETYQSYGVPWANLSNTPFRLYKSWVHEGGISSPLIIHWPEQYKVNNEFRKEVTHLIDIMATCVDVSQTTYPNNFKDHKIQPMEGKSLIPILENRPFEKRTLFWEHEGARAVREGRWKLVAESQRRPWELYDMEFDRTEINDLATKYPEILEDLGQKYQKWAIRANVLPNKKPPSQAELQNQKEIKNKINWAVGSGKWQLKDDLLIQTSRESGCYIFAHETDWTNYTYEVKARKTGRDEGFLVLFRMNNGQFYQLNIGGWENTQHAFQFGEKNYFLKGSIEKDRWYSIKVILKDTTIKCYLDQQKLFDVVDKTHSKGGIGLGSWVTMVEYKNILVKSLSGDILYQVL
jgi:arylsulfatase A-like enzyme